jgi:serine/threonine protein kinase
MLNIPKINSSLNKLSNNKYSLLDEDVITTGAFSKILNVKLNNKTKLKNNKNANYILKLQSHKYKYEAKNEIEILLKLKKNKTKFKSKLITMLNTVNENNILYIDDTYDNLSKIVDIDDYYIDDSYFYIIMKKYECTLEEFNIIYNKEIGETLPTNLIKKIINSLFVGLYELQISKIIHCDIKPNNILIEIKNNKSLYEIIKLIKKDPFKSILLYENIDIKLIDFNKSQRYNSIYKSTSIQTIYYMAPEIILNNKNFNNGIDVWSIGAIIYELVTSCYLFDIFNENEINGKNYNNYNVHIEKSKYILESNKFRSSSKYSSDSSNVSSNDSSYDSDMPIIYAHHLALLTQYHKLFNNNNYIYGLDVPLFYHNNKLLTDIKAVDPDASNNFEKLFNSDISYDEEDFNNKILNILKKIFVYNITERISVEEFIFKNIFYNNNNELLL